MAKAANKDSVAADIAGPEYAKGLAIIRDRIVAKKAKVGEVNGEISGLWDQIEKLGINKRGARIFLQLDALDQHDRRDVLRTITNLAEAAGWDGSADLVDTAEGAPADSNVVEMPKPKKEEEGEPKLDPAAFKAVMVEHFVSKSDLSENDAYAFANTVFESLTTAEKKKLTPAMAVQKADDEMDTWPEDGEGE